jgi:hypothetical protein
VFLVGELVTLFGQHASNPGDDFDRLGKFITTNGMPEVLIAGGDEHVIAGFLGRRMFEEEALGGDV